MRRSGHSGHNSYEERQQQRPSAPGVDCHAGDYHEDNLEGRPVIGDVREGHPSKGRQACRYWRSDADGIATCGHDRPARAAVEPHHRDSRGDPRSTRIQTMTMPTAPARSIAATNTGRERRVPRRPAAGHPPTASDPTGQDCAVSVKLCAGEPSQVRWVSCVLFVAALAAVRHLVLCRAVKW